MPVAGAVGERRIVAAVEDLFFLAKIQETARQLGVHLTVAKTEEQVLQTAHGEPAPTLIILDLNGSATKPLSVIGKLRKDPALKKTSLVGFLSHLQADLKAQAQEAGCDLVMPRSAFSQNLPSLLRRHGLPESA